MRVRWLRCPAVGGLVALAMVVAACSGGDGAGEAEQPGVRDENATAPSVDPASPTIADSDAGTGTEGADGSLAPAGSFEELEAQWAQSRAELVEAIRSGGYRVDNGELTGSGGFGLDSGDCPAAWSDTAGVDEASITVAMTLAQSGELFQLGFVGQGLQEYVDHVNSSGGVAGRQIDLRLEDDGFVAQVTAELATELAESGEVFSVTTVGFPGTVETRGLLNDGCVPHLVAVSRHPAWGDGAAHPWTVGNQLSFRTEALLWGAWIEQNLIADLPVTVAALVADDDLGVIYEQAFRAWADAKPEVVAEFVAVKHPSGAASVGAEMAQVAAAEPDVVLAMTEGESCVSAMAEAAGLGMNGSATALFVPSVCRDPFVFTAPAGTAADGWWVVDGGFKATSDPAHADDPWVAWVNDRLEAAGYATSNEFYSVGFAIGWAHVEALRIAAELDGGLTRTNYLLALRTMSLPNPNLVDGVTFEVDGVDDPFFVEGSQFSQWDATAGEWVQRGEVIDLNGQTGPCSWQPGEGC